jgi:transcriptional regulator with GAF, ATPase, and Fis domain
MFNTATALQSYIPFDYMVAGVSTKGEKPYDAVSYLRVGFNEYQVIGLPEFQLITKTSMKELADLQAVTPAETEPTILNGDEFVKMTAKPSMRRLIVTHFKMQSLLSFPLEIAGGETFHFFFYSRRSDTYKREHVFLLRTFRNILVDAVEHMLLLEKTPSQELQGVTHDNKAAAINYGVFEGIIGKSHHLLGVFDHISQVAPVDTSVLILGESGTGKEKIAQSIHDLSRRSKHPMVKINCAALPASLIESELFGHEKGAFTGALDKRIGKFELADKGTIFLDEVGEMPLELQSKLLRVLQEKEIERIGGRSPIKIDVRIIAATNRDLEKEVAAGRFRLDLYYRLNIFPVMLPALRERKEDIPLLADHFIHYFNRKIGKSIKGLSKEALRDAVSYSWPGNIRELENLVERGVLLAKEDVIKELQLPKAAINGAASSIAASTSVFQTIEDNEREHIIRALKKCNGKVWGAGGAAELLDIPASTLNSRMKKLGIKRTL